MKKVMIAVDSKNNSKAILSVFNNLVRPPENIILVHVEQLEGNSMMTAMLGEAEMSTLREMLKGTEHKEALDRRAEDILNHYKKELCSFGLLNIKTIVREGHPAEELMKVAEEEKVDLVIVGCSGKSRIQTLMTGCTTRDIERSSRMPVLVAKEDGCKEKEKVWEEAYVAK